MFKRFRVNPFDLLGQNEPFPIAVYLPGNVVPKMNIEWQSFHQGFFSEIPAFFKWTRSRKIDPRDDIFYDCRVRANIPVRAVFAAALWHILLFVVPWPKLPVGPKHNSAFDNTQLTWSGPIDDLPLLNVLKQTPKRTSRPQAAEAPGPDDQAFHPRQRIYTDPVRPTHPRQTLVRSDAPMEPPRVLTPLPNLVQLASTPGPPRPHLEISEQTLAKLRPKEVKRRATTDTPPPDAPNLETHAAEFSLATTETGPARPRLTISAGSAPRLAEHQQAGDSAAPELPNAASGAGSGSSSTIIALSASPAPPAPVVEVPKGNLAASVAISPEGKGSGSSSGSGTAPSGGTAEANSENGGGANSVGISISGGSPKPNAGMSGLGVAPKLSMPRTSALYKRPDSSATVEDPPRTGPPNFASLPPGAPPEQVFQSHHVYSMNVNMPNLNSVTGSWVIHFVELHQAGVSTGNGDINAPAPLRKIDPKYPQEMMKEHVEGEVILYGVIRPDGSVDSIQVVHKLDPQLDANSVAAFKQWKFEPAMKNGQPVALEAIVHIPFRGPERE